ncbi:hypothetical protein BRC83_00790 [Halobacteriales archaeon QS_1_68_17]|nr:MAG: hypothetical protein BRC83_00790 [Halobacteriales archaeon QS_1_68_17]
MRIYAALADALLVAAPGEQASERLDGHRPECVAVSAAAPDRVFCGTFEAGLWRSTDGGDSFERVGADAIDADAIMSATVSPHDPAEVWVGTEPSALYRSSDGGDTWEALPPLSDLPTAGEWYFPPRPSTHHVRWIEIAPRDPRRLYVGIEAGAFLLSEDGGRTWTERPPGSRWDNHSLATHPDAPGRVYAAAGDGYAESGDSGESWRHPQEGLDHRYVWSVRPDPGDPDTVLVSAARGARSAHSAERAETYVYRRRDAGPWERLDDRGLPVGSGVTRPVLATTADGAFYAASNRGLFRSTDAGDSWTRVETGRPERFADGPVRGLAVVG